MTPAAIIQQAAAEGVTLSLSPAGTIKATGNGAAVSRWLPILRENKPALVAALAQPANDPCISPALPLSDDERAALDRLARSWGMDEEDRAIMLRQCERGGELSDGSWISPEEARAFWLAEAGTAH